MNIQYVINHIRYLFFMLFFSPPYGTAVMENKHISTWHYEPWNCPLSPLFALSFPFILLPAAHPSRSFWGPLAAVPIIHYKTQHPHQALANLYSSAKAQREEERGRGLVMGQILSLCLFGPLTKSKAKRPPPRGWERSKDLTTERRENSREKISQTDKASHG